MIKAYFVNEPETTFLVHSIEDAGKFLTALKMLLKRGWQQK